MCKKGEHPSTVKITLLVVASFAATIFFVHALAWVATFLGK